jgi:predicted deacylase
MRAIHAPADRAGGALSGFHIEIAAPDLRPYAKGNRGIPYVTTLDSGRPGRHIVLCALMHGNEICGAVALDRLFRAKIAPARGQLTLVFANIDAYRSFDPTDPTVSRYLDEDMNRLWDATILDGKRMSAELRRARALRPIFESADWLLDLHSMQYASTPLALAGTTPKSLELARRIGLPGLIVRDKGHAAGPRLRDFGDFNRPAAAPVALLVECGQHWEHAAAETALGVTRRFLAASGILDAFESARILAEAVPPQRVIDVTEAVTVASDDFRFLADYRGLEIIPKAGTVIARDGGREIATPYDDCVLIMPSRRLAPRQTAVRLGRYAE